MRLHEIHLSTKYQMSIKVMAKTLYLTFDLEGWPYDVTNQNVQPCEIYMYTKYQMSTSIGSNIMPNVTYIFDLWPWPWHITPQNMRLYKIHILSKYQVSISLGPKVMNIWPLTLNLQGWPWPWQVMSKMCSFKKYTCITNIKSLSLLDQKLWPKL